MRNNWKPKLPPFRLNKRNNLLKHLKVSQFIYQLGEDDILSQKSTAVPIGEIVNIEYKKKFNYIKKCLINYRKFTGVGRGITASQVGIPERFSIVYIGQAQFDKKVSGEQILIIINPRIIKTSKTKYLYPEMCMSAVPIVAPVVRPAWIEFEYFDVNGQKQLWAGKDDTEFGRMMNRVFQHEIDHMDGVINIFKVADPALLFLESDPEFYSKVEFTKAK